MAKGAANLGSDPGTAREETDSMMLPSRSRDPRPQGPADLLFSVVENTELGVLVVDATGHVVYANGSARTLIPCSAGSLPEAVTADLRRLVEQLARSPQAVERWQTGDNVLRVRARPLDRVSGLTVLELTVAHAAGGRQIAEQLARSLNLSGSDAGLLALLWRGLSNEEIANLLSVRVGTIKSRLFRLYQKLGVKRRPAAVLRAAEVIQA
jgi:regulatory LuxR family protein